MSGVFCELIHNLLPLPESVIISSSFFLPENRLTALTLHNSSCQNHRMCGPEVRIEFLSLKNTPFVDDLFSTLFCYAVIPKHVRQKKMKTLNLEQTEPGMPILLNRNRQNQKQIFYFQASISFTPTLHSLFYFKGNLFILVHIIQQESFFFLRAVSASRRYEMFAFVKSFIQI